MNILFVCKYNAFRSKVAEAYFKKINKNRNIKVKSRGIIGKSKISPQQKKKCKELGITIKGKSKGLTMDMLKWADLIIITANDVPKNIFMYNKKYPRKVIIWKIKDVFNSDKNVAGKRKVIIKEIIKKADKLNKDINEGRLKWKQEQ